MKNNNNILIIAAILIIAFFLIKGNGFLGAVLPSGQSNNDPNCIFTTNVNPYDSRYSSYATSLAWVAVDYNNDGVKEKFGYRGNSLWSTASCGVGMSAILDPYNTYGDSIYLRDQTYTDIYFCSPDRKTGYYFRLDYGAASGAITTCSVTPPTCTPSWTCTSWSTCSGSTQTRTCTDSNNCGVTTGKPATSQSCSSGTGTCGKWRILSHPTWTPDLQQYHYDAFNMFFHFNAEPGTDGSIDIMSSGLMDTASSFVQTAHSNNDLALYVIGGEGYGSQFLGAMSSTNRAKFVQNVKSIITTYGYDGVVIDWEENVNNPDLVQTIIDLRSSLNTLNPKPLLLIDVCCDVQVSAIAQMAPYVDSINAMEYTTGMVYSSYFGEMTSAGVPASKIINGLGFYSYVSGSSQATSEVQYTINNNMKGIEVWDSSEITSASDSRLTAITNLLGTGPACISTGTTCTPSWTCTSWSTCSGSTQTRTCTDSNNCGVTTGKPATSQSCSTSCRTTSDTNCDGIVSRTELGTAINNWIAGTLSRTDLGNAIQAWATG